MTTKTETAVMQPEAKERWQSLDMGRRQATGASLEPPEEPALLTFSS